MDSLNLLHTRVSCAKLTEPGPTSVQKEAIFKSALRTPDHGSLQPWRFVLVEKEGRNRFADALHQIKLAENADEQALTKAQRMPLRAPTIIVVIATPKKECSSKITILDQEHSAVAACQNIILAVEAQGLAAIWRTGWPANNAAVNAHFGLQEQDRIVGFLYIGSRVGERRSAPQLAIDDFVEVY